MDITKEQASLLADLAGSIQEQYGIIVGYTNPEIPMPILDVDFIIYENDNDDHPLKCFHKDDMAVKSMGNFVLRVIRDELENDDKVQSLFDRLDKDLLDGIIGFDPGVTRTVDGHTVSVTKKNFPGMDEVLFDTNIMSTFGSVYPYRIISENAKHDKKFEIVKGIIDELWPESVHKVVEDQPKSMGVLDQAFELLRRWFLN